MRTAAAMRFLESIKPTTSGVNCDIGSRGDVAHIRLTLDGTPDRWAVVSTPGDRWFSLDVDGGFSLDYVEEETSDDEVHELLQQYVQLAVQYLANGAETTRAGWLKSPALVLSTDRGTVTLRRSLVSDLRAFVRLGRRR